MIAAEKEIKIYKALANGPNIAQLYRAVRDPKNQSRIGYVNLVCKYYIDFLSRLWNMYRWKAMRFYTQDLPKKISSITCI